MRARHLGLIGLLVLIDSLCFVAIEIGTSDVPPLRFAGLRAGLGGLILLVGSLLFGAPIVPARRLWPGVGGLALLSTTVGYSAMFLSPHATGAGIASVVGNTGPLFLVIFGVVLLRERLTRAKIEALGLAAVGIGLIAISQSAADTGPIDLGFLVPLGAAVAAAGATVLLKRLEPGRDVVPVAMWQLMFGALPILAVSQLVEPASQGAWTTSSLLILALGAAAFLLYYMVFLTGLELTAPEGYIDTVWNLEALSGVRLGFMPLEELLWAAGFGAYWAGLYEHYRWMRT